MSDSTQPDVKFEGEEAGTGYASPALDMIASIALILLSIVVMIGSFALPVPADLLTAPGLLPFIVAASLLLMALGLGASAVGRWRQGVRMPIMWGRDLGTDLRSIGLAVVIAIYIAALQILGFREVYTFGEFRARLHGV